MDIFLILAFLFFHVFVGVVLVFFLYASIRKNKILSARNEFYEKTYLSKTGSALGWGVYRLVSLDGGLTWYASEISGDKTIIKGLAEEVFPGLLDHLQGFEALVQYVKKNGTITITGPEIKPSDLAILKEAGFTVERK